MSKIFHVMYDDDAKVMTAAGKLVGKDPSEGCIRRSPSRHRPVIGIKRTRLAICSFMYAMTGTSLAFSACGTS